MTTMQFMPGSLPPEPPSEKWFGVLCLIVYAPLFYMVFVR